MEQPYMLPILYWWYLACWCSGDFRSQNISRHGIDPQSWNIPSPASEELMIIRKLFLMTNIILAVSNPHGQTEIRTQTFFQIDTDKFGQLYIYVKSE